MSDPHAAESAANKLPATPVRAAERRHRQIGWRTSDVLRAAAAVAGMYLVLRLIWIAQTVFLTAFLGVLFGLAVSAGVDWVRPRVRVPRGLIAALIVLGAAGAIVGFFVVSGPVLATQSQELQTKLPEAIDKIDQWAQSKGFLGSLIRGRSGSSTAPAPAPQPVKGPETPADRPTGAAPRQIPSDSALAVAGAKTGAAAAAPPQTLKQRILEQLAGLTRYLFGFLSSTISVFAGLLLILVLSIYIGADPDTYHDGLMKLFPRPWRKRAGEVLTAISIALRKWLVTQLIAMVVIGVVSTVVLLILGVNAAVPLGVIAGLLEFVPTVGPILSALPAIAMGFVDSPQKALAVIVAYIAIQQMENYLLIPFLMREGVDLPPALTIIAQALMALIFGFLGLLCAVPLLAASMVAVKMLYVQDVVGEPVEVFEDLDDD
ncbi:MAG TPA: AI-2E family transporter [Gemmatimonadaceae bacterium]|jgi:predicted PurR-regulated permease PerM|nr:AI-2E family transporter [Gemmatimonadaceae bacterium]